MYTLYYLPNTCSMATHTVLNLLDQPVKLRNKTSVKNYRSIIPSNLVPAIQDGETIVTEGAAVLLYLLNKHENSLLPTQGPARQKAIENIMFANATMHPAYGRLFFAAGNIKDEAAKLDFFNEAANAVNTLWQVVENKLESTPYLGGKNLSVADILLSVYSRWGEYFPVDIIIGKKTQAMISNVLSSPAFQDALAAENADQSKA